MSSFPRNDAHISAVQPTCGDTWQWEYTSVVFGAGGVWGVGVDLLVFEKKWWPRTIDTASQLRSDFSSQLKSELCTLPAHIHAWG